MTDNATILRIAVPVPLRKLFDYRIGNDMDKKKLIPGVRVKVPFGSQKMIGILVEVVSNTDVPHNKLKSALEILDHEPVVTSNIMAMAAFTSDYYHHPLGDVMTQVIPTYLRQGKSLDRAITRIALTPAGQALDPKTIKRSKRQQALIKLLQEKNTAIDLDDLIEREFTQSWLKEYAEHGYIEFQKIEADLHLHSANTENDFTIQKGPQLNAQQQEAYQTISQQLQSFATFVLFGVTGSGKTEVYFRVIENCLRSGKQILVLVPEIALTPQTIARFKERFQVPMALFHSGLTDKSRCISWADAKSGRAKIIIGTRSAIFTPLPKLGLIIIDEEHDSSYKQQEGLRYSARDLSVWRARQENIPLVLGSATPSLETMYNINSGRYQRLSLDRRAGTAKPPVYEVLDIRNQRLDQGLSARLLKMIEKHLAASQQVMLFLNRRGFAPSWVCHQCGWVAQCERCDASLVLHQKVQQLRCHHCGANKQLDHQCPHCKSSTLCAQGLGTERIEKVLAERFSDVEVIRIDRDTTARKGALSNLLDKVVEGKRQILVGTQMLAKGHHFPNVTLVAIINADSGFYSADLRASERIGQLILQVAGRAGRENKPGEVLIQSRNPENPLLRTLLKDGYEAFVRAVLEERQTSVMPPYSSLALIRAESVHREPPLEFLGQLQTDFNRSNQLPVELLGPIPAPMLRKAGMHRALLLVKSQARQGRHVALSQLIRLIEGNPWQNQVRWSLDVDPLEMF